MNRAKADKLLPHLFFGQNTSFRVLFHHLHTIHRIHTK